MHILASRGGWGCKWLCWLDYWCLCSLLQGLPNNFNHPALKELCVSFTMATPPQLGIYFLMIWEIHFLSMPFCWWWWQYVMVLWNGYWLFTYHVLQIHCSLVEVRDSSKCVPFSAEPTYKGLQQALVNLLNDLDALPDHGPKLCKLVHKLALHRK